MASAPDDSNAEVERLRAEVAALRAEVQQRRAPGGDEWKGLKEASAAIERGDFEMWWFKRMWRPWHTWFAVVWLILFTLIAGYLIAEAVQRFG